MNKSELITAMSERGGVTKKDAERSLNGLIEAVTEELKSGGKVQLVGFGTFEVAERPEREGRNPSTGETITIKAAKVPKFKAGKAFKDAMN